MTISVHNRAFLSNCLNSWCAEALVLICGTVDLFLLILLMDIHHVYLLLHFRVSPYICSVMTSNNWRSGS
jgi:hypothetical protein